MDRHAKDKDSFWMSRALELAGRGLGCTSPNPPVGAVIVREGRILGEGWHHRAGEPHAERMALADAVSRGNSPALPGSTIYVTLEPCSSYGKTPPCTEGIISAGISRVVYACKDPDKRHRGRADALLRAEGIEVLSGVLEGPCGRLLRPWAHAVTSGLPWVTAKIATTMDSRLTRHVERWLSCPESLRYAHDLRCECDAILVGGQTVRSDNPSLTIRCPHSPAPPEKVQPLRIVLTHNRDSLPKDSALFTDDYAERTLVFENVPSLREVLTTLREEHGVVHLMLECGGKLLRQFLEEGLINEWYQIITPQLAGGPEQLISGDFLTPEVGFQRETLTCSGQDIIMRGILRYN